MHHECNQAIKENVSECGTKTRTREEELTNEIEKERVSVPLPRLDAA
jgi:hypothetical protein